MQQRWHSRDHLVTKERGERKNIKRRDQVFSRHLFAPLNSSLQFFKQILVFRFDANLFHRPPIPRRRKTRNDCGASRNHSLSVYAADLISCVFERKPRSSWNIRGSNLKSHNVPRLPLSDSL